MKIRRLETLCLSRLHEPEREWFTARFRTVKADCAVVVIETDEGLQGVGEACAYGVPSLIKEAVVRLSPLLVGCDPCEPFIVPHPNGRSCTYDCAVGGIDAALWDIRGKASGKPVCHLLSDRPQQRVRLYASSGCRYDWGERPEQVVEEALGHMKEGFTAYKFRIGTEWSWDGVTVDRFLGLVRELAQAIKGKMELMVEGNSRLTEEQALGIGRELDRLGGFTWFEEPVPKENLAGYSRLCAALEIPISGGERFTTVEQFLPFLEHKGYDIVQQDAGCCGITEGMKIARLANCYGVDTCPHNWHNGLMTMANAHLVAALPNPRVLELCQIQGPLQWEILKEKPVIRNGYLELPNRPGLGVELAENLEERFPYIEGNYAIEVQR